MKRLLPLLVAFVAACTSTAPQTRDNVTVVWNRVADAQAACQALSGRKEIFAIRGCAKWSDGSREGQRVCSIYAPVPRNERDAQAFATLGHELMHCFDGNWHDRWGNMTPAEEQAALGASHRRPRAPATAAD